MGARATDGTGLSFTDGKLSMISPRSSAADAEAMNQSLNLPVVEYDEINWSAVVPFRNTTHGSLNHHVSDHAYGGWGEKPMVVVAPFKAMVQENGAPTGFNTVDTYWALPPDGGLKVADATLVIPGDKQSISPGAISAEGPNRIFYRADGFDQVSEDSVRLAQTTTWVQHVSEEIVRQGAARGHEFGDYELQLDRSLRTPGYNTILEGHLAEASKKMATDLAIKRIGPVRLGGMHGWQMPQSGQAEERVLAAALGASTEKHFNSRERKAMQRVSLGAAAAVAQMSDVSPATREFAYSKEKDALYGIYATRFTAARGDPPPLPSAIAASRRATFPAALDTALVTSLKGDPRKPLSLQGMHLIDHGRKASNANAADVSDLTIASSELAARPLTPFAARLQAWRGIARAEQAKVFEPAQPSADAGDEARPLHRASRSSDLSP